MVTANNTEANTWNLSHKGMTNSDNVLLQTDSDSQAN